MKTIFTSLLLLGLFLSTANASEADCNTYKGKAEQVLAGLKGQHPAGPGFIVAYACNGDLIASLSEGEAVLGGKKLDLETPVYLASLAKQFTAALALQLVEEGVLSLDDPPTKYLANLPKSYRHITLWQMLTHTSGIPDYFQMAEEKGIEIKNNADVHHLMISSGKLEFEPGTDVSYSNSAYVLIAEMIEAATGQGYGYLLEERIFKPLGMDLAWVNEPGSYALADPAIGYETRDGILTPTPILLKTYGAGGIYMSMADYLKWNRELNEGHILSAFVREKMLEPAVLKSGDPVAFSAGWIAGEINRGVLKGKMVQQMFGDLGGYRTGIRRFPEDGLTVIWFANNGVHLFDADLAEKVLADPDSGS